MGYNNDILVSICCIVYNQALYLRQTLDGFVSQKTNFRYEVLINDDCSTDGSIDIIKEYESKYPNIIKPLFHSENQYSKGIQVDENNYSRVQGKYIALCEGDDYWIDADKLQIQTDFLESNPNYSLTYTDFKSYDQKHGAFAANTFWREYFLHPTFKRHLMFTMYLAPCTWVFRTKDLPHFARRYVDGSYRMMLYFLAERKVKYIDRVTAVYRILYQSASHSSALGGKYRFMKGLIQMQDEVMDYYKCGYDMIKEVHYNMYNRFYKLAQAEGDYRYVKEMRIFWRQNGCRNCSDRLYYCSSFVPHLMHVVYYVLYNVKYFFKNLFGVR